VGSESLRISVVVLAYQDEPLLSACVEAILSSTGVEIELILVNNGSPGIESVADDSRIIKLNPGTNTGFAGGCNLGVAYSSGEVVTFVNSDLVVEPLALFNLAQRLADPTIGLATGAVVLPGNPVIVNSVGNPTHYLMISWSGSYGDSMSLHTTSQEVQGISGALFGVRREFWDVLGGFDEEYLAYAEDSDLSLRTWQSGKRVFYESTAVGVHHYDFGRSNQKWYLLERNRVINFLTLYNLRSTFLLFPMFLVVELGIFFGAARSGWWRQKVKACIWVLANIPYLRKRRKRIAKAKGRNTGWAAKLAPSIDIPAKFGLSVPTFVNRVLRFYWSLIHRFID